MPFQVAAHYMIRKVAMEAAGEMYERLMADDVMFSAWKKSNPGASGKQLEKRFILRHWSKCIPFARTTLGLMLSRPLPDDLKESIIDALH